MAVELTRIDECAVLTLNRPDALNALSFQILRDIGDALNDVATMPGVRALLITGTGAKAFCAGADIKELQNRPLDAQRNGARLGQQVFSKLDRLPVASIALVNGYAFGGGLELALAATFRLCSSNAKFGLPEIKLGLIPGYGGTQRLPRLIGVARATEWILAGRTIDAQEAVRVGLVHESVAPDDLLDAGLTLARSFTRYSLPVLQLAREAIQRGMDMTLEQGLQLEAELSTLAYRTRDAEEGMQAFIDKRNPEFTDD